MTSSTDDPIPQGIHTSSPTVPPNGNNDTWHTLRAGDIAHHLGIQPESGLSSTEAEKRFEQYGPNELEEAPRPGFWRMVLDQFNNFIVIFLIVIFLILIGIFCIEFFYFYSYSGRLETRLVCITGSRRSTY